MFEKIKDWFNKKKPKCTEQFVNESMNYKVGSSKFRGYPMTPPPAPPKTSYNKRSDKTDSIQSNSDDGFATSVAIGYVANDGLVGGIIGGNLVGGMIGDALNTSESTSSYESTSYDSGSSSSYDSSSYDSGSCDMGGGDF
jgi:hypothetical protein